MSTSIDRVLQFEGVYRGWGTTPVNFGFSQRGQPVTLEDNASRSVRRFADGTVEVLQKGCDYHHQTIVYPVKTSADWERVKAIHLQPNDPERFPADWPDCVKAYRGRDYPLQLTHGGVYGFARNLMGDEQLLYALCDAPDLVHAIMEYYTDMVLTIWNHGGDLDIMGKACDRPSLRGNDDNLPHRRHDGGDADLHGSHLCIAVLYCVCAR